MGDIVYGADVGSSAICWPSNSSLPASGWSTCSPSWPPGALLASGSSNKNDPNDARSVAVAALRSTVPGAAEDHVKVMKVWAKRHRDLPSHRTGSPATARRVVRAHTRRVRRRDQRSSSRPVCSTSSSPLVQYRSPIAVACELVADLHRLGDRLARCLSRGQPAIGLDGERHHHRQPDGVAARVTPMASSA